MKRHALTILCLVLAVAFYSPGVAGPATGLLILGVLAEAMFWYRLASGGRRDE